LFVAASARAECPSRGLELFPAPGSTVPTNTRFILEGLGNDGATVSALVGQRLYLASDAGEVEVTVQRGWKSTMSRVAVWLKPAKTLAPNADYRLELTGPLQGMRVLNAGPRGVVWRAGAGPDSQRPVWRSPPHVSEGEYDVREGGLARHVKLHLEVEDESPVFLVVTARRKGSPQSPQTYFVPLAGDVAALGHNACTGSFGFVDKGEYHARVQLFDAAGHAGPTADIEYFAPAPHQ
jgi:hypothetical protein